jgi:hypothetical protein
VNHIHRLCDVNVRSSSVRLKKFVLKNVYFRY